MHPAGVRPRMLTCIRVEVYSSAQKEKAKHGGDYLRPWEAEQRGEGGHAVAEFAHNLQSLVSWSGTNSPQASREYQGMRNERAAVNAGPSETAPSSDAAARASVL